MRFYDLPDARTFYNWMYMQTNKLLINKDFGHTIHVRHVSFFLLNAL